MKKIILGVLTLATIQSCQNGLVDTDGLSSLNPAEFTTELSLKTEKIDVCHKGNIISINRSSISDHQLHGDAIDFDNDGYFDKENACETLVDCDDSDPSLQEKCVCPVWTYQELSAIGTYGKPNKEDFEQEVPTPLYYDLESGSAFFAEARIFVQNGEYRGYYRYGDGFAEPEIYIFRNTFGMTESEFNICKQELKDHITNNSN